MSRRYSSWRSLSSPNIRSSSTSENPITAFSGVRSSCDMLARNSDLCWLTTSSSARLGLELAEQRAFHTASADWLAKVSRNSIVSSEKAPGRLAAHDQRSDDPSPAEHGDGEHRPPAVVVQQLQVRVEVDRVEVGDRDRMPLQRGPADERGLELDPDPAQLAQELCAARVGAAHGEAPLLLDVLHDRSAVAAREAHGVHDDVREHLVEHEARTDHAADLAQRLQLLDLAGELDAALLERAHEVHVAGRRSRPARRRPRAGEIARSSNGSTSVRTSESAPTTSSSRSIGAAITVRNFSICWTSCRPYSGSLSTSEICMDLAVEGDPPERVSPGRA